MRPEVLRVLSLSLPHLGPPPSLGQQEKTAPKTQAETSPSLILLPPCPHLRQWHQHPWGQAASMGVPRC